MNRDHIKGSARQAKGSVKDAAGKVTSDSKLQAEGKAEKVGGKSRRASAASKTRCEVGKRLAHSRGTTNPSKETKMRLSLSAFIALCLLTLPVVAQTTQPAPDQPTTTEQITTGQTTDTA